MIKFILRFLAWATLGSSAVTCAYSLGLHAASFENLLSRAFIVVSGFPLIVLGAISVGETLNKAFE